MKLNKIAPLFITTIALLSDGMAGTQIGIGAGGYLGSQFDETGYGLNVELGGLMDQTPVDLFTGLRATYVDGLTGDSLLASAADMDIFEGAFVARVLFPLATDHIKFYAEGGVGAANLQVSGKASAKANIGGRDFTINSDFDENNWVLAWSLGAGIQLDLTQNIGLRAGYDYHGFGDVEIFGMEADPGNLHGFSASLVLKF